MEFVGRKVKINLSDNSIYDGYVHSVDSSLGKLTLEKVVCTDADGEKTKLLGLQNIFTHEITSIFAAEEVIKSRSKEGQVDERRKNGDRCIMKPKMVNQHLDRLGILDPKYLTLKNTKAEDGMNSSGNEDAGSSEADEDVISHEDYTVIGKMNNIFHEAIEHIRKHMVIGMAMEGVSLGRNGKLCWVQVAIPGHVIVFDILRLGQAALTEGLQAILEAESILKVFHDCRMVSDMMFHQYGINLTNVFDTQVANAFVYRLQHHNDWPRHVHGLASCLIEHLNLQESQVNWAVIRDGFRESDEEVWLQRPLKRNHLEALRKNVTHLLDLRQVLVEKMMEEYVAGVNIYLSHARDASNGDIQKYQRMSYLLPSAFQDIRHFMRSSRNPFFRSDNGTTDVNGFRENYSPIKHPKVIFSRDSLWHTGNKTQFQTKSTEDKDSRKSTEEKGNNNDEKKPPLQKYASQLSYLLSKTNNDDQKQGPDTQQLNVTYQEPVPAVPQLAASSQEPNSSSPTSQTCEVRHDYKATSLISKLSETLQERDISTNDLISKNKSDHVTEAVDLINREQRIKPPTVSTSQDPIHGEDHHSVSNTTQEYQNTQSATDSIKHMEQLSGSSLMRALINKQAPPGSETHCDLDEMTIMPAGKVIGKNMPVRKKRSPQTVQQLDRPVLIPGVKRLTEQEIYLVNRLGKRSEHRSSASHTDSIVGDHQGNADQQSEHSQKNGYHTGQNYQGKAAQSNTLYTQSEHKDMSLPSSTENQQYRYLPWQKSKSNFNGDPSTGKPPLPSRLSSNQISSSEDEAPSISLLDSSTNKTSPTSGRLQALMQAMNKN